MVVVVVVVLVLMICPQTFYIWSMRVYATTIRMGEKKPLCMSEACGKEFVIDLFQSQIKGLGKTI